MNSRSLRFYDRRIRRIAPALLLVLIVTTIAATLLLLPMDLIGYAKSLLATVGFVANIYFWRDADYFSRLADEKPLLHMWSLGVEEQFYVLFPLLLLLLAKYDRRRAARLDRRHGSGIVGFQRIARAHGRCIAAPFICLPTRAWELGLGALIVFLPGEVRCARGSRAGVLGTVGAALVALGCSLAPRIWPRGCLRPCRSRLAPRFWYGRARTRATGRRDACPGGRWCLSG